MPITWLDEVDSSEFANKRVLLRVDFNVPMDDNGTIVDDERIKLSLPTIRYLLNAQAKLIIMSHLGRPKGKPKTNLSLEPVAVYLRDLLNQEVIFVHDCVGDGVTRIVNSANPSDVICLENLRFHPGEEKNDPVFGKMLARNMDMYVDDAFGAIHRSHASVDGVTKYFTRPMGGLLLKKELDAVNRILTQPKRPLVAIIGGAKISSKIGVFLQLLKKVDAIVVGGAMAYTFLAASGANVGRSLVEEDRISLADSLLRKARDSGVSIYLPQDHVVVEEIKPSAKTRIIESGDFSPGDIGVDIGPKTIELYQKVIRDAGTIFCNGPMGMYEIDQFAHGTNAILETVARASGYTVVGGGDSIAALKKAGLVDKIDFVSSGGGALLELLEGKTLPGLAALSYYGRV